MPEIWAFYMGGSLRKYGTGWRLCLFAAPAQVPVQIAAGAANKPTACSTAVPVPVRLYSCTGTVPYYGCTVLHMTCIRTVPVPVLRLYHCTTVLVPRYMYTVQPRAYSLVPNQPNLRPVIFASIFRRNWCRVCPLTGCAPTL